MSCFCHLDFLINTAAVCELAICTPLLSLLLLSFYDLLSGDISASSPGGFSVPVTLNILFFVAASGCYIWIHV